MSLVNSTLCIHSPTHPLKTDAHRNVHIGDPSVRDQSDTQNCSKASKMVANPCASGQVSTWHVGAMQEPSPPGTKSSAVRCQYENTTALRRRRFCWHLRVRLRKWTDFQSSSIVYQSSSHSSGMRQHSLLLLRRSMFAFSNPNDHHRYSMMIVLRIEFLHGQAFWKRIGSWCRRKFSCNAPSQFRTVFRWVSSSRRLSQQTCNTIQNSAGDPLRVCCACTKMKYFGNMKQQFWSIGISVSIILSSSQTYRSKVQMPSSCHRETLSESGTLGVSGYGSVILKRNQWS